MAFTKVRRQVGAQTKYTVLDYEQREHEVTLTEIEFVAKRDPETFQMFIDWLGGPEKYEQLFEQKAPKIKKAAEVVVLSAKRTRKAPAVREYTPVVADSDYPKSGSA